MKKNIFIFVLVGLIMIPKLSTEFYHNGKMQTIIPPTLIEIYEPMKTSNTSEVEGGYNKIKISSFSKISTFK